MKGRWIINGKTGIYKIHSNQLIRLILKLLGQRGTFTEAEYQRLLEALDDTQDISRIVKVLEGIVGE